MNSFNIFFFFWLWRGGDVKFSNRRIFHSNGFPLQPNKNYSFYRIARKRIIFMFHLYVIPRRVQARNRKKIHCTWVGHCCKWELGNVYTLRVCSWYAEENLIYTRRKTILSGCSDIDLNRFVNYNMNYDRSCLFN